MSHAIRCHEYGGPEVIKWDEVDVPAPGPGQAKIRHHYSGLNFIDIYHRTGLYPQPKFPFVLGTEGAGEVVEVGPGVTEVAPGDRVGYVSVIGSYAEERLIPAERLVKLPDSIDRHRVSRYIQAQVRLCTCFMIQFRQVIVTKLA
jgi:NADPH2:quinone reductase